MRFEIPADKKLVHEMQIPIRWGDMDAMRHVNNATYFRYFETIRVEWLHSINAAPNPDGEGPVIVNAFCNFLKQLEFPGTLVAKHYVANVGRSSFDTFLTLERTDGEGIVHANGGATVVWIDLHAQKSRPLPDWLRGLLS
jgi:acyl-CoA thioester hydrolase